jgi:hypothetical protein
LDKNLIIKSKVLYNEFKVSTKIIEPKDLISELERVIDTINKEANFIGEAISFCNRDRMVESMPVSDENEIEYYAFKLPKFYFNYFNYVIYRNYPEQERFILTFRKVFKNFSRFIYYTESERLIDSITDFFGYNNKDELEIKKRDFIYENKLIYFDWNFEGGMIRLEKEEETKRPFLHYIISTKNISKD